MSNMGTILLYNENYLRLKIHVRRNAQLHGKSCEYEFFKIRIHKQHFANSDSYTVLPELSSLDTGKTIKNLTYVAWYLTA